MSNHDANHDDPHGQQSADQIDFKKVIGIGIVALFVFALGTLWAVAIFHHETERAHRETGVSRTPALNRSEIGIVDQVLFEGDHRLAAWRAERTERLNGYGWVDRSGGIAHIPIDRAMDQLLAGALPVGAPK